MKDRGIVLKLFLLTSTFFVLFLLVVLAFQTTFFERFYLNDKVEKLSSSTREFRRLYEQSEWDEESLSQHTARFTQAHNVQLGVVDEAGRLISERAYYFAVAGDAGQSYRIHLNSLLTERNFEDLTALYGKRVEALGFSWNEPFEDFSPLRLTLAGEVLFDHTEQLEGAMTLEKIQGTIRGYRVPTESEKIVGLKGQLLWAAIDQWYLLGLENSPREEPTSFAFTNPADGLKHVAIVQPMEARGEVHFLFAITSKQPIDESIEVLRAYYGYALVAAIVMVLVLSLLYSLLISRPLVRINRAAKKMAELDFSEELPVGSGDEIGSLSRSLNTLARNLQKSLAEQRAVNLRLREDIERDRESEKQRTAFIGAISHELKTPLGIIQGYAEGIRDEIAKNPADYADVIIDEVAKIDRLVQDMLELSRIQMGTAELEWSTFDLTAMIDEVAGRMAYLMRERGLTCHRSQESPVMVRADRRRIEQVLMNLFSNALRYSPSGGDVWIETGIAGKVLTVAIENEAARIPEEKLERLFDQFYRLDESRNKTQGGTGLGLAIVKDILERHGFPYGVANTERGLRFFFQVPLRD